MNDRKSDVDHDIFISRDRTGRDAQPPSEHGSNSDLLSFRGLRRGLYIFIFTVFVTLSVFLALGSLARSSVFWAYPLHHRGQAKIHLALSHSCDDRPAVLANPRIHSYVFVCLPQLISKVKDRSCPLSVAELHTFFMHHVE